MKKMQRKQIFVFAISALLLSSCTNFMSGGDLFEQLEASLDYLNKQNVSATISKLNPDDTSAISNTELTRTQKLGYPFEIFYTPGSVYVFNYWRAVNDENVEYSQEEVHFEDKNNPTTTVTINTQETVHIQAVTEIKPTLTLTFKNNANTGKFTSKETVTLEMNEEFTVSFLEEPNYQFIKFQSSLEGVEFENAGSSETKITAKKGGSAIITAECAVRPAVKTSNTLGLKDSICKDTSIIINFDRDLAKENDLSKIRLLFAGNDLCYGEEEAFGVPYFYTDESGTVFHNQVIIPANKYNSLDVTAEEEMQVIIPEDFYYIDSLLNEKIYIGKSGKPYSWSYYVNSYTNTKGKISLVYDNTQGTITGGKADSYNIGDEVTFEFKLNSDSEFTGWEVKQVPEGIAEVKKSGQKVTLKIVDSGTISVEAKSVLIPKMVYNMPEISTGYNYDTPIEVSFTKKIDESFFTSEYISIIDKNSGVDYTQYFTFVTEETADGIKLICKPDYSLNEVFASTSQIIDLEITFSQQIRDVQNKEIENLQPIEHKISGRGEDLPPEIKSIQICSVNDFTNGANLINNKPFASWEETETQKDFENHHVGKSVYIKVVASDMDSGVSDKVTFVEQSVLTEKGVSSGNIPPETNSATLVFDETIETTRTMIFYYTFTSEKDGLINLTIGGFEDKVGNKCTQAWSYDFIRDTSINLNEILVYNTIDEMTEIKVSIIPYIRYQKSFPSGERSYEQINADVKQIYVEYSDVWFTYQGIEYSTPLQDLAISIKTPQNINSQEELDSLPALVHTNDTESVSRVYFEYTNLAADHENNIVIAITDLFGNEDKFKISVPEATEILGHTTNVNYNYHTLTLNKDSHEDFSYSSYFEKNLHAVPQASEEYAQVIHPVIDIDTLYSLVYEENSTDKYYCVAQKGRLSNQKDNKKYMLYGLLGEEYTISGKTSAPTNVVYPTYTADWNIDNNTRKCSVTITWDDITPFNSNLTYSVRVSENSFLGLLVAQTYPIETKIGIVNGVETIVPKENSQTFELPSWNKYYLWLQAKDLNGYTTEDIPDSPVYTPPIDFEPPSLSSRVSIASGKGYSITFKDNSGFDDKPDLLEYWVVPYFEGVEDLTQEEVEKYPYNRSKDGRIDDDRYYRASIFVTDENTENKAIFVRINDIYGNVYFKYLDKIKALNMLKNEKDEPVSFSIKSNNVSKENSLEVNFDIDEINCTYPEIKIKAAQFSEYEKIFEEIYLKNDNVTDTNVIDLKYDGTKYTHKGIKKIVNNYKSGDYQFLKFSVYRVENANTDESKTYYAIPTFCCLTKTPCTEKRISKLSDKAIAVSTDGPCLVFTISSSKNRGTDKNDWMFNGIDSNYQVLNGSDYYSVSDSQLIENGYYVICCVFSDNSFYMTDPIFNEVK